MIKLKSLIIVAIFSIASLGQVAPNFNLRDTKGTNHNLYDYLDEGKHVIIDFTKSTG